MAYLVRGLPVDKNFRVYAVCCKEIVEEARRLQGLSPVASAALGRALAGVALLSADLKIGKVLLQIKGDGPLGEILAEGDYQGFLRGTVQNPHVYIDPINRKLPVGLAVGKKGFISVVKDLGLKEPYYGSVELISGEIAEDLAYYLTVSEQIPSAVSLGVLVDRDGTILAAGGFLVQKLPEATESELEEIEAKLKNFPPVTSLLSSGKTPEEILQMIFPNLQILEKRPLAWRCTCSEKRVEEVLIAMGRGELEGFLKEGKPVSVTCEFCKKTYHISLERVKELLKEVMDVS
ncbi:MULTISPECIES: Hsp33 family molecular chaperone HslO [Thermodesulfobacterium]|jgi:molecular chaperone Hsp33|uniref:33 kDa chaperonin n=2 Tax=Thermodesulfobacterium commune TaxID=1741 RepID=A0A075WV46_9BACT|nr:MULTISPECIES: Hsp33 family molecular chaperone HslO [Thermodesulfobacterium]KUJ98250.1 MAG: 33 kDa chaperonin [Thermodesulfobacterium sp. 37_54]KUK19730.1 MAG: 33 kDa chaperonin [Thermodesulfobacterium commune]AIH04791.1 heat shock protein Hsp33 [Thermodesulfobacterium commune DSM 2178]KUK38029.1 MAG: 33 kDa chaperonin [Thermodesulfobacterium commune]MBZ4681997.1 heat shock protein Hsp33 [Thermodesulfobacterium sp.]